MSHSVCWNVRPISILIHICAFCDYIRGKAVIGVWHVENHECFHGSCTTDHKSLQVCLLLVTLSRPMLGSQRDDERRGLHEWGTFLVSGYIRSVSKCCLHWWRLALTPWCFPNQGLLVFSWCGFIYSPVRTTRSSVQNICIPENSNADYHLIDICLFITWI